MKPQLLVIQHEDTCPAGLMGDVLSEHEIVLDVRYAHRGDNIPAGLDRHDALMVLGGAMGAHDDADFPWLTATKDLLVAGTQSGHPVLGVCLGHQLLNVALGGRSAPNPRGKARGLTPYAPTLEAATDPLLGGLGAGALGLQWNDDVAIDVPEGAVVLATAPDGSVQAVRFGPSAWGVQFHPEATPEIFRSWAVHRPVGADPLWQDKALHDAADEFVRHRDAVARAWRPLAVRFAEIIHTSAAARPITTPRYAQA
ncbi:MAG: type 1 glutamine amidotransferase [Ornithinimicrobium sp.]